MSVVPLLIAALLSPLTTQAQARAPSAILRVAESDLSFPAGSPSAVAYNMARRAVDPSVSEAERKGDRKTYFSTGLQSFQSGLSDDQWRDFDADDITGVQDSGGFKVKSVVQGMYGHDIEVVVTYATDFKDKAGKALDHKIGYTMKQDAEGEWKVDDIVYHDGDSTKTFRSMIGTPKASAEKAANAVAVRSNPGEFRAAIGHKGYGRCHMDSCGFFIIDRAVLDGSGRDGQLFRIEERDWEAEYKQPVDNDPDPRGEYDRPPIKVDKQMHRSAFVYCSKSRPTVFDFFEGKWSSTPLRPGDDSAVFGANESAYQWYFAACHDAIVHDPNPKNRLAYRLGYRFKEGVGELGEQSNAAPQDMLK